MTEATTIVTWAIAVRAALTAKQLDAEALFTQAGLDINLLSEPNARYPVSGMSKLWELATSASGNSSFPLTVPNYVQPGTLHGLGLALLASATLGDALQRLERFSHIVSTAAHVVSHKQDQQIIIEFVPTCEVTRHAMEAFIATTVQITRMMLQDSSVKPVRIELRNNPPEDSSAYHAFFGCDVLFAEDRWALVMDAELHTRVLPLANAIAQYYTLAWFDRYLKLPGELGYDDADQRLLNDSIFAERFSWYFPRKRAYTDRNGTMHSCENIASGCQ